MQQMVSRLTYRLFIPDIIPLDRVIYLDCDILVNMDIKELWDIDTEGNILTGSPDLLHGLADVLRKKLCEIDYKSYINSGVLIMDAGKIRGKGNLFSMSMDWFAKHSHIATLPDQDALNSIFRGHIKIISRKYNKVSDDDLSDSIVHLLLHKSWQGLAGFRSDAFYWKYYLRSAWGENVTCDELIDIVNDAAREYKPRKKSSIKIAAAYIKARFLFWQPVRIIRFLYREARYRLTRR